MSPNSEMLTPLLEEAYSYGFDKTPNYGKLKHIIEKLLMDKNEIPNCQFSWVLELSKIYSEKNSSESISSEGSEDGTDSQNKLDDVNIGQDLRKREWRYSKKTNYEVFGAN